MSKASASLEARFDSGAMTDRSKMLQYGELHELCELLIKERDHLQFVINRRNEIEGKAHALL